MARPSSSRPSRSPRRNDWLLKSLAGALLGLGLAIALSGLFAWLGPGGLAPLNKYQFSMWIVPPLWLGVLSAVFLFPNAARAWLWLGGANALAWLALCLVRQSAG